MLPLLNALQLVLYIGLLALLGQGVLYVLAGAGRDGNGFYRLFGVINRPWLALARLISPSHLGARQHGYVAFFTVLFAYLAATLAKIEHCVSVAMRGCL